MLVFFSISYICGRCIKSSLSIFSCLVLLLSLLSFSFNFSYKFITSFHLSFGLAIFRYPLFNHFNQDFIFLLVSSSVFLSMYPNHLSLTSQIFSLMFATPVLALPLILSTTMTNKLYSFYYQCHQLVCKIIPDWPGLTVIGRWPY